MHGQNGQHQVFFPMHGQNGQHQMYVQPQMFDQSQMSGQSQMDGQPQMYSAMNPYYYQYNQSPWTGRKFQKNIKAHQHSLAAVAICTDLAQQAKLQAEIDSLKRTVNELTLRSTD
jgi:hypothetical protein